MINIDELIVLIVINCFKIFFFIYWWKIDFRLKFLFWVIGIVFCFILELLYFVIINCLLVVFIGSFVGDLNDEFVEIWIVFSIMVFIIFDLCWNFVKYNDKIFSIFG